MWWVGWSLPGIKKQICFGKALNNLELAGTVVVLLYGNYEI